jgi:hypothetical protein
MAKQSNQFHRQRKPWPGYYKWYKKNYGTHGYLGDGCCDDGDIYDPSSAFYDPSAVMPANITADVDAAYAGEGEDSLTSGGQAAAGAFGSQAGGAFQSVLNDIFGSGGAPSSYGNTTGTAAPATPSSYAGTQAQAAASSPVSSFSSWIQANPGVALAGGALLLVVLASGSGRR